MVPHSEWQVLLPLHYRKLTEWLISCRTSLETKELTGELEAISTLSLATPSTTSVAIKPSCTHIYIKKVVGIVLVPANGQVLANGHSVSGDRREIFKWLSPTIPSASYDEALKIRLQKTGVWFIKSEQFWEWKRTADLLFWLYGKRMFVRISQTTSMVTNLSIAGCGKTIIRWDSFSGESLQQIADSGKLVHNREHIPLVRWLCTAGLCLFLFRRQGFAERLTAT
jgi:hypothetical protein